MVDPNDRRMEILLSQEKDKFYLETGFQPEQISKYLQQQRQANEPSPEERKVMLEKIREQFLQAQQQSTKTDGESASNAVESGDAKKPAITKTKTVTLE